MRGEEQKMITVCVKKFRKGELEIRLSGHAGLDERGKDIVCAGVSALFFALGKAPGVEVYEEKGAYVVKVPPEMRACGEMAISGWMMIAEEYTGNVECRMQSAE